MMNERRKNARMTTLLPTTAWAGIVRHDITLVNTSAGGGFLACKTSPILGSLVEVHLWPEGEHGPLVLVTARVVHAVPRGGYPLPGVGVAWLSARCAAGVQGLLQAVELLLHIEGIVCESSPEGAHCVFTGMERTKLAAPPAAPALEAAPGDRQPQANSPVLAAEVAPPRRVWAVSAQGPAIEQPAEPTPASLAHVLAGSAWEMADGPTTETSFPLGDMAVETTPPEPSFSVGEADDSVEVTYAQGVFAIGPAPEPAPAHSEFAPPQSESAHLPPLARPGGRWRSSSWWPTSDAAGMPAPDPPRAATSPAAGPRHRSYLHRGHTSGIMPAMTESPEPLADLPAPPPTGEPVPLVREPPRLTGATRSSQPLRLVDAGVLAAAPSLNESTMAYVRPSQRVTTQIQPARIEPQWPEGVPTSLNQRYGSFRRLGQGGLGVVYCATDLLLDRPVVLKFMVHTTLSSATAGKYFLREVKLAASLNHINIVHIYDMGRAEGVLYYAMEFVDGRPLTAYLPAGMPMRDSGFACSVMAQLGEALDYAHGHNVLHRDVKPDNVLVAHDGTVKLFDFGLARAIDQGFGEQSVLIGTPHYMAPEQLLGGQVDRRTDIYSLGIVMYRMLTGQLPFTDGNLFVAHATEPVPDPRRFRPELPAAVVPVLERMLAKEPAARYEYCGDAVAELRAALGLVG